MRTPRIASVLIATLVTSSTLHAQRRDRSSVIDGVRVTAVDRQSSTGSPPREPTIELHNGSSRERVVTIRSVTSVGGRQRRSHRVVSPHTVRLAPGATERRQVRIDGAPLNDGVGAFTLYRFAVAISVDEREATVEVSNRYVCRIPIRR